MDEVETGFKTLVARIEAREKEKEALSEELRKKDAFRNDRPTVEAGVLGN